MGFRRLGLLLVPVLLAGCSFSFFQDRVSQPGSAAEDLVSSKRYDNLVIELDHPPGHAPDAQALADFKAVISGVVGKRSVTIETAATIPAEPGKRYSWSEIEALERQHRQRHSQGEDAVLYLLYVAGGSEADSDNGKVLGAAYRGTSLVLFKGNVRGSSNDGGLLDTRPQLRFVERAVLVHEFGHAAGLVNLGAPMVSPHEDPEHPGHSNNRDSVMYWAVENSAGLLSLFTGGRDIPYQFDAQDKADLAALQK